MTTWKWLKQVIDQKGVYPQYTQTDSFYCIRLYDGQAYINECEINKLIDIEDKEDFETNYKALSNAPLVGRNMNTAGEGIDSLRPRTMRFTAAANSTTSHYFLMDVALAFRGGYIWSSGQFGDYIQLSVTDKDNLLGYGADFELKEYIKGLSIIPNSTAALVDVNVSQLIPAGFYFKILYTNSHASNSANVLINYLSYVSEE